MGTEKRKKPVYGNKKKKGGKAGGLVDQKKIETEEEKSKDIDIVEKQPEEILPIEPENQPKEEPEKQPKEEPEKQPKEESSGDEWDADSDSDDDKFDDIAAKLEKVNASMKDDEEDLIAV